ncbi:alpha/beta hydrolase [Shewanella sp. SNU WT4]|uniref:alpha/beta fold hydrolase n=1 Tax=Shewanella sp. SNU WT4 TaxID=2590015 RepID=UPI001125CED4|nr:alpha/beta fold hydrolase [Shewanella sp. SNU WT4]QDF66404.1 alpha/beta hydrolase [Shewanella sp. SNU WT4]
MSSISTNAKQQHCEHQNVSITHLEQQSHFLPFEDGALHVRSILAPEQVRADMPVVLLLHGAMSNGKVFYSDSGKGLGCYLARNGMAVYVMDTFGRGQSEPSLNRHNNPQQESVICQQLPLVHRWILQHHPEAKGVHWCAHSWGGVLMASSLVRMTDIAPRVLSLVCFGSKRTIKTQSLKKYLMVDLLWNRIAPRLARKHGYFDARHWRLGMDNESQASLLETIDWVAGPWIGHQDGFDYSEAAKRCTWPPAWFFAGARDTVLGNPRDVQDMMAECQLTQAKFTLLAKANGHSADYGHGDMLTSPLAISDHFPVLKDWWLELNAAANHSN